MESQATVIEKLFLSALIAAVTATVSAGIEVPTPAEGILALVNPGTGADR